MAELFDAALVKDGDSYLGCCCIEARRIGSTLLGDICRRCQANMHNECADPHRFLLGSSGWTPPPGVLVVTVTDDTVDGG